MSDTPRTDAHRLVFGERITAERFVALTDLAGTLERENTKLLKVLETVVNEVSWFVSRKPNLANTTNSGSGRTWADLLNEDLHDARAVIHAAKNKG